jgi:hypothetical protein
MKNKKIINLTPHTINVVLDNKTIEIPSSGVARCSQTTVPVGEINGIPLTSTTFGEVIDLPEPTEDTLFVVSRLIMSACPTRTDLLVPNDMVRDEEGKVIGCKSFAVN